jgi:hypothetical protein
MTPWAAARNNVQGLVLYEPSLGVRTRDERGRLSREAALDVAAVLARDATPDRR